MKRGDISDRFVTSELPKKDSSKQPLLNMIKYAIILLSFSGLLTFGLADGIIIEDNTPTNMQAGESKVVEITVNKGEVSGFAKLELVLPPGLSAEAVDTKESSFTFSGQKAKFIWMSLPDQQRFTVRYRLTASPTATGNLVIKGTFSYIKENQRVDYEMQSKLVAIGLADDVAETTNDDEASSSESADNGKLACDRKIQKIADGEFRVTVMIMNADLDGFAKITETLAPGFDIVEEKSSGAIPTIENGGIKFVWFEAPVAENFEVSYLVTSISGADPEINGIFAFVADNTPQEMNIGGGDIEEVIVMIEPDTTTETEPEPEPKKDDTLDETTADTGAITIPDPETGVTYKVQIVAGHRTVGKSYFRSRHRFSENFSIENHEGWVKYTIGSHGVYKKARDERERINSKYVFPGPFVTAYNEGARITVQEALMISNQKWYQ